MRQLWTASSAQIDTRRAVRRKAGACESSSETAVLEGSAASDTPGSTPPPAGSPPQGERYPRPAMTTRLVTGGAGFLGSHMCDALLRKGHRVICVDNLDTGSLQNVEHDEDDRFKFLLHDLTEPLFVEPTEIVSEHLAERDLGAHFDEHLPVRSRFHAGPQVRIGRPPTQRPP